MGRPPAVATEDKLRLVLSVISGEMTIARAARHGKVSEQSVGRWKAHVQLRVWRKSAEGRLGPSRTSR